MKMLFEFFKKKDRRPELYTFMDVEWANSANKSICQIGLVSCDIRQNSHSKINLMIDPEDDFDFLCTQVHGITKNKVEGAPNFATIWPQIEELFTNTVIVGHNVAGADIDALVKTLSRYSLSIPEIYYIDTLSIAKECISKSVIRDYKLQTLCEYFCINTGRAHNAFDDAVSTGTLFFELIKLYKLRPGDFVQKYIPHEIKPFKYYISEQALNKIVCEFYGMLCGILIDKELSEREKKYLEEWKSENKKYINEDIVLRIIEGIDLILYAKNSSYKDVLSLKRIVKEYVDTVNSSSVTAATQILDGIMKGIISDGKVTEEECGELKKWLDDNEYLSGHYPFNRLYDITERVLEDGVLTQEESEEVLGLIDNLLNPLEQSVTEGVSAKDKHICLSGDFIRGSKAEIKKILLDEGAIVEDSVKRTTDILIVGDLGSDRYSNGTYGLKVKKAMEYNDKGCKIQIIKESDYFKG